VIRLVTFDFWDTLVTDSADNLRAQRALRVAAIRRALGDAGAPVSEVEAEDIHERSGVALAERFWSLNRDPSHEEQLRIVLDTGRPGIAARLDPGAFAAALDGYISPVLVHPPDLSPGADRAVRELAARGVRLGIVSNTGRTPGVILRRVLERYGLLGFFKHTTFSDEVGIRKPAPEIFALSLRAVGGDAATAVHVGDDARLDVDGAHAAGMRVIQVRSTPGRPPAGRAPDAVITSLRDLPGAVESLADGR